MTCDCVDTSRELTGSSQTRSLRVQRECPRDRDALALPAGELVRVAVREVRARGRPSRGARRRSRRVLCDRCCMCTANGSPTLSAIVRFGSRELYGSWNTICIDARTLRSSLPLSRVTSAPSKSISPAVGSMRRSSARPVVDLPDPLSPDEAERLARRDLEADAVDGLHRARRCAAVMPLRIGNSCAGSLTTSSGALVAVVDRRRVAGRRADRRGRQGQLVEAHAADHRAPPRARVTGTAVSTQRGSAYSQRGWNRQPLRHLLGTGHGPRDHAQVLAGRRGLRHRVHERGGVRMARPGEQVVDRPLLDGLARVQHRDLVADLGDDARGRGSRR